MKRRASHRRERAHRWAWAFVDGALWAGAIYGATWLRFDFEIPRMFMWSTPLFAGAAVVLHLVIGAFIGPYAVGHKRGSFEESADIARTVLPTTAVLLAWALIADPLLVARTIPVVAGALALTGMFAARFVIRAGRSRQTSAAPDERRVVVFGAGDAGRRLVRDMLHDEHSGYFPVALLDDDRAKRRLRIDGVRVRGSRHDLAAVATELHASALVIAMPEAESSLIRELSELAAEAGLDVLTLPPLRDIIDGHVTTHDLRDLKLQDLLGRHPIDLDTEAIAGQIAGRSVLVTGAGGSIGSELCRQIARFGPAKLYMLDRDESGLQETQISLTGQGLLEGDEVLLADIRDPETMQAVFASRTPDIVFHAAALKHLPLLESYPLEAWKTNVLGTLNVLNAAAAVGVGTFVNISTDKAAHPTSVLGYSKRITERLTAGFAAKESGRYVSVRFGNVLGSRGSVVHVFTAQIKNGGPVTLTHPDVERYFMLIPEACQLVLEAASIGTDGEVMVLEMGEQVKIEQVARTLIQMSGRTDIDITYTGLRPGEKLGEELFSPGEGHGLTSNPLVMRVAVPPLTDEAVRAVARPSPLVAAEWMRGHAIESTAVAPAESDAAGLDAR